MLTREMISAVAGQLISAAEKYDPEMVFAIVLQLYAGLRSAEVCCLCQEDSVYGPSVKMSYADRDRQDCISIKLDLRHSPLMRSDATITGRIKAKRIQEIFPEYVPTIETAYKQHLVLIQNKPVELTAPLFLCKYPDKKGVYLALTVRGYRSRVKRLYYDHVLPACREDANPILHKYFQETLAKPWGPRNLRQWYLFTFITRTTRKEDLVSYSTYKDLHLHYYSDVGNREGEKNGKDTHRSTQYT